MTAIKNEDEFKRLMYMSAIPKEMFWAYMAVQQSGIWNMMCVHPIGRYYNHSDPDEMLEAMTKAYYKFIIYTGVDIEKEEYMHLTKDHIRLMQHLYGDLYEAYGKDYPKGVVNISVDRKVKVDV